MKQRLNVLVEKPDLDRPGHFKKLFHVINEVDDSLLYDYSSVIKAFHQLFPKQDIYITFKIG